MNVRPETRAALETDDKLVPPEQRMAEFALNPEIEGGSPSIGIDAAMIAVMKDIGAIGKNQISGKEGSAYGFKYRGIADVYDAAHAAMIKHGIYMLPEVVSREREERQAKSGGAMIYTFLTVRYKFVARDGTFRECTVCGEGMDSGDKSSNKALAAAHKYAITQSFVTPYSEMIDGDADTPETTTKRMKEAPHPPPSTPVTTAKPPTMQEWATNFIGKIKAAETQEALAVLFNGAAKGLGAIQKASPGLYASIMAADEVRRGALRFPPDPMADFDDKLPDFS